MPATRPLFGAMFIFMLSSFVANGQAGPASPRTACVFPFVDFSPPPQGTVASAAAAEEADRSQSLSSAISAELSATGFRLVPETQWRAGDGSKLSGHDFLDPSQTSAVAGTAGAGLAVSGFYSVQNDKILISVSCYETRTGSLIAGFMKTWRYNLGIYSVLHDEMKDLLSRLSLPVAGDTQKAVAAMPLLSSMTFVSPQEGMEVLLAGERSAGKITGGRLIFEAPGTKPGEILLVEKRLAGYHSAWESVRCAPVVPLSSLSRVTRMAIEAQWTFGQLIGVGAAFRYYPVPDSIFLSFSLYPYGQVPASQWGNWLFHADSELSAGSYLVFPPDSPFRLAASAGLGVILSKASGSGWDLPLYVDSYLTIIGLSAELSLPGMTLFLRPELKVALGITSPNLLGTNIVLAGGVFPPVTLGAAFKW